MRIRRAANLHMRPRGRQRRPRKGDLHGSVPYVGHNPANRPASTS